MYDISRYCSPWARRPLSNSACSTRRSSLPSASVLNAAITACGTEQWQVGMQIFRQKPGLRKNTELIWETPVHDVSKRVTKNRWTKKQKGSISYCNNRNHLWQVFCWEGFHQSFAGRASVMSTLGYLTLTDFALGTSSAAIEVIAWRLCWEINTPIPTARWQFLFELYNPSSCDPGNGEWQNDAIES